MEIAFLFDIPEALQKESLPVWTTTMMRQGGNDERIETKLMEHGDITSRDGNQMMTIWPIRFKPLGNLSSLWCSANNNVVLHKCALTGVF